MSASASRGRARVLSGLLVLAVCAAVVVVLAYALRAVDLPSLGGGPECVVQTEDGEVGLDRDEARQATTAVALQARGQEAETSGIDAAVLRRLTDGPPEDAGPSLSCRGSAAGDLSVQQPTDTGLTPRAEQVRVAMAEVFGDQSLGGFAPGGVYRDGESTHDDARAIDVFYRPVSEENRRQGWILAHWLVAHADELDVQYVIFDDRFWSVHSARGRWQDYEAPEPGNEILRHLDHVHVDVLRGDPG